MNPNQIRDLLLDLFRQHSALTLREGSVVTDQIVGPLALLMEPVVTPIARLVGQLTLPDPTIATDSDLMVALGEHLGLTPKGGKRSVAAVRLIVAELTRIEIPSGAQVFAAEGQQFETERSYVFAPASLSAVTYNGIAAYTTPPFLVTSTVAGSLGAVAAGAIRIPAFLVPGLLGVTNDAPSSSVSTPQTLVDFKEELRLASSSRGLDTAEGGRFALLEKFGSDYGVPLFIRSTDPEMRRDATFTRRYVGSATAAFSVVLTRTAGATTSVAFSVDEMSKTASTTAAATLVWADPESDETGSVVASPTTIASKLPLIPYGFYWALVYKAGAAVDDANWAAVSSSLQIADSPADSATLDLVASGRRGDPAFVTRVLRLDPANATGTLAFSSTLREVSVERASAFYGFEGKIVGAGTVPHRLLKQRPTLPRSAPFSTLVEEATQGEYARLSTPDFEGAEIGTSVLYRASFVRDKEVTHALGDGWVTGNTGEALRLRDAAAGVCLYDGLLVMGPTPFVPEDIKEFASPVAIQDVVGMTDEKVSAEQVKAAQEVKQILALSRVSPQVMARITAAIQKPQVTRQDGYRNQFGNTSPVVMRRIADEHGFKVAGTFWTTDDGNNPMAITMARTAPSLGPNKFRWYEGFGIGVSASDGSGRPNVFVTDNGANDRNITVVGEEYVGGKMAYGVLAQTSVQIAPRTRYRFEISFGAPAEGDPHAITLTARIWPDGGSRPVQPTISYGAYVPVNRRDALLAPGAGGAITATTANARAADYVGFGVSQTQSKHYWTVSEFQITNIDREYAQALLEIKPAPGDTQIEMMLIARSSGFNPAAGAEAFGHDVAVWNVVTETWDEILFRTYDGYHPQTTRFSVGLANHVSANGRIYILVSARYPHQGTTLAAIPSVLEVDYVEGGSYARQIHSSGKADIYVSQPMVGPNWRPSEIRSIPVTASRMIEIDPLLIGGPVEEIISLTVEGGGSSIFLEPSDYRFFWKDPDLRGSMRERLMLAVDPALSGLDLVLTCRVHTSVPALDLFLTSSDYSKSDADLLGFHKQSVFLDVSGRVFGAVTGINDLVRSWIVANEGNNLRVSTLVDFLYSQGTTDIPLSGDNRIRISARRITSDGNSETVETEVLSYSRTEQFVPGNISLTLA